ncbi:hypothetical protein QUV96_01595 [Amedibacillus dolichus]|uniref:DUF4405 domain-containing protein n=1 Tax=Amedibacillus dolichus TaxID=31971 RepID=A0ABT7UBG7_9FIRM|nr:hypothetical protein [Amedibacillus dolichus]MDM8156328.1 hypothetical protein [Amedibacillus dolichus]
MKKNVRWIVDVAMTVLLLMARQLIGDRAHEWLGAGMFVLWILHHLLNLRWWTHLTKGRYSLVRTLSLLINLALFAAMLTTMVSGIILSREVFAFLNIQCAHRCLFLELCADGSSSGTALGHGARSGAQGRRKRDGEKRPMGLVHPCCGHGTLWDPCTDGASDPIIPVPERFLRIL